jgi:hypothetical protein
VEFSDEFDLIGLDDETGIVAGDSPGPWEERNQEWSERQKAREELEAAIKAVNAGFDRHAAKYLAQQRRNPGLVRPELAGLIRDRNAKVNALNRAHWRAEAYERAARDQPVPRVTAHERAVEKAAARSLQIDLGRGRHLRDDPADVGRHVHDTWIW